MYIVIQSKKMRAPTAAMNVDYCGIYIMYVCMYIYICVCLCINTTNLILSWYI